MFPVEGRDGSTAAGDLPLFSEPPIWRTAECGRDPSAAAERPVMSKARSSIDVISPNCARWRWTVDPAGGRATKRQWLFYPRIGMVRYISRVVQRRKAAGLGRLVEERPRRFSRPGERRNGQRAGAGAVRRQTPVGEAMEGKGPGVFELVERHDGDAYRAVSTVSLKEVVHVLRAFQKKSPSGIRTAQSDVELVSKRLKAAQQDYEARYGKPKS